MVRVNSTNSGHKSGKIIGGIVGTVAAPVVLQRIFRQNGGGDSFIKNVKTFVDVKPENTLSGVVREAVQEACGDKKTIFDKIVSSKSGKIGLLAAAFIATIGLGISIGNTVDKLRNKKEIENS